MESAVAKSPLERAAFALEDELGHLFFDWFILGSQGEPETPARSIP